MEGERGREREILKNKKTQRETKEIKNEMTSYYNKSLLMTYTRYTPSDNNNFFL